MELFVMLFGCLLWNAALIGLGVWLGMAKPWRKRLILVDRAALPSPTAQQGRPVQPVYYNGDEDDYITAG